MVLLEDYGRWIYWWGVNKERYLQVKNAVHDPGVLSISDDVYMGAGKIREERSLRPSRAQIRSTILPALLAQLDGTRDRDVTAEALIALAKIGSDVEGRSLREIIEPHLSRRDARVREAATLALGIAQDATAIRTLIDLLDDTGLGRKLVGRDSVGMRTRAFAAYGLGCLGAGRLRPVQRERVARKLLGVLNAPAADRRLRIAAIGALGALRIDQNNARRRRVGEEVVRNLVRWFELDLGRGEEWAQAHVPPAVGKLLAASSDAGLRDWAASKFMAELQRGQRRSHQVRQSAVIGLGLLASPCGVTADDRVRAIADRLWHEFLEGRDEQTRSFALMAMAQSGGVTNRNRLIAALRKKAATPHRPWAALALGVLCRESERDEQGEQFVDDPLVVRALQRELRDAKNPDLVSALTVALGLARAEETEQDLRSMLERYGKRPQLAGYLCTGLALLDAQRAVRVIQQTVAAATRKPGVLRRGAIALALLQQKHSALDLIDVVRDGGVGHAIVAAVAPALGMIGDRNVVDPLVELLDREGLADRTQSMVALALGGVADKEQLPWYERFAAHVNYRAGVPTLGGSGNGVLDRY